MEEGPPRLLILEDEVELREALFWLLEDEGYQVAVAADAREALEKAPALDPEIMVLDVRLPGPDGLEVLGQLKEANPELLSLVITGFASEADSIRAIRLGVGDYLRKPFAMKDFLAALEGLVRMALGKRSLRRQKVAGQKLASWALASLSGAHDLSPVGSAWNWRQAASAAHRVALHYQLSAETARTLEAAVLLHLLRQSDEFEDPGSLLVQTLPDEVVGLARRLDEQPGFEPSPEGIGAYAVALTRGLEPAGALGQAFLDRSLPTQAVGRNSEGALLGLARALMASGQPAAAEEALNRLVAGEGASRTRGQGWLSLARLHQRSGAIEHARQALNGLVRLLPRLARQEAAELRLEAGLVAIQGGFLEGKTLLREAAAELDGGLWAKATIALWCLGEGDQTGLDRALEKLGEPHRHDLLVSCAPWLLPVLLERLPSLDTGLHRRVVQRLARESPAVLDRLSESSSTQVRQRARQLRGSEARPRLRLASLGCFEVAVGAQPIESGAWRTQKARFLLACVAARNGKAVPQETLVDQFWPSSAPERGLKNLYQAVSDARKALGLTVDPFTRSGTGLGLNPELEAWSDLEEFDQGLEEGQRLLEAGQPAPAREVWKDSLRLYRGPYLEDCPMEWALPARRHYELKYETFTERLAELCLELGHPRETLELAGRLFELEPSHQNAHRLTMEAYIAEGRPEEAVRQYERVRILLLNEFGSEPSIELVRTLQKAKLGM
ncbi:MAG: BTAD domain-containing putative transcriptional regulator [Vulcanimicrobiota bacterium]